MSGSMETYINRQLKYWQQQKSKVRPYTDKELDVKQMIGRSFITISREYGCGGFEIAGMIAKILNEENNASPVWAAYDKKILEKLSSDLGFTTELAETLTADARTDMTNFFQSIFSNFPTQVAVYKKLSEIIRTLAVNGNVIIVGRGGNVITRDMSNGLHFKVIAPLEWRIDRISGLLELSKKETREMIKEKTKKRRSLLNEVLNFDITNPYHYHLVINNSRLGTEEAARLIIETMKIKGLLKSQ